MLQAMFDSSCLLCLHFRVRNCFATTAVIYPTWLLFGRYWSINHALRLLCVCVSTTAMGISQMQLLFDRNLKLWGPASHSPTLSVGSFMSLPLWINCGAHPCRLARMCPPCRKCRKRRERQRDRMNKIFWCFGSGAVCPTDGALSARLMQWLHSRAPS